jgi:hypothetical protein
MALAGELWNRFSARVRHFHMSGFIDEVQVHEPFSTSHCDSIISALPTLELPIILEIGASKLPARHVRIEFEYVSKLLAEKI